MPEVDLFQREARQMPFVSEFDVIGAFDVLEHIVEDEAVLEQIFRATRPGGGILVTVPQHPFVRSANDEHSMHQRRYRRADLRRKVGRAGCGVGPVAAMGPRRARPTTVRGRHPARPGRSGRRPSRALRRPPRAPR